MGAVRIARTPIAPRGSSRIVDLRDGWFRYGTIQPGGAFGGGANSTQIINLLSGQTEAAYFNVTNQSTVQIWGGLLCQQLPNSAVNAGAQYERIIAKPIFPPPAMKAPAPGSLGARGPLVYRQWWTIAFSGAAAPNSDVGVTLQGGVNGGANTLSGTGAGDGGSGMGVLMVEGAMRFRAKRNDNPLTVWMIDEPLTWPGDLTDWVTVEWRIIEKERPTWCRVQLLLNGQIAFDVPIDGTIESIPVAGSSNMNVLPKCRNRDTGPAGLYVREYGLIVGPDEAGTY